MKARFMYAMALCLVLWNCSGNKTGGDRDEHGCIGSAGYQWSELRQECIRPFESGVKLLPEVESSVTIGAYIIFGSDSARAEVFMSELDYNPILDREGDAWSSDEEEKLVVRKDDGRLVIEWEGVVKYREE